jgi:phenylacetate-CoA ligase
MRWRDAAEARAHAWLGTRTGERRLEVRCRPVGRAQRVAALLLNAEAIHAPTVADRAVVGRLLDSVARQPPALVWGVSNALYTAALALLDAGRTAPTRAVWSGGNHLHEHYRRALGEAFACPVYERYATMETGLVAHECVEAGSMHVPAEGVIAEIVRPDGSAASAGETGDVLLTALRNQATPLVRYRVGDRATAPAGSECACGRGLPVFGAVAGRARDVLRAASGATIGPRQAVAAMRPLLADRRRVIDFQAIQEADATLRILVVQGASEEAGADRERAAAIFAALVAPPAPPRVERVERLALTPGGKVRTLISNLVG